MGQVKSPDDAARGTSAETCRMVCLICKKTFATKNALDRHIKKEHAAQMKT